MESHKNPGAFKNRRIDLSNLFDKNRLEISEKWEMPKLIFRYLYEKLTMGKGLYPFVDRNFGIILNLILNKLDFDSLATFKKRIKSS